MKKKKRNKEGRNKERKEIEDQRDTKKEERRTKERREETEAGEPPPNLWAGRGREGGLAEGVRESVGEGAAGAKVAAEGNITGRVARPQDIEGRGVNKCVRDEGEEIKRGREEW